MKTDKELLELAAKAGKVKAYWSVDGSMQRRGIFVTVSGGANGTMPYEQEWNPLKSDADTFRLAVALQIDFYVDGKQAGAWVDDFVCLVEDIGSDAYAATRRAIVRAAAAIGERL